MTGDNIKDVELSNVESVFGADDVSKAAEVGNIYSLINSLSNENKSKFLDACNQLAPRDLFLAVLIANGYDLDIAFLKAIHFDNPSMYLMKKPLVLSRCKDYILSKPALSVAIVELRDTALQQYTERAKINKNLVMCELVKLKNLCMSDPFTYKIALDSLKLIGQELGMFNTNATNKFIDRTVASTNSVNSSVDSSIDSMLSVIDVVPSESSENNIE